MSDFDNEWKRQERRIWIESIIFGIVVTAFFAALFISGVEWR